MLRLQRDEILFTYRFSTAIISVVSLLALVCSVIPFYAFGLHQQPVNAIIGGSFDPKGFALYQLPLVGAMLYALGIIMYIALPIVLLGFAPIMGFSIVRAWQTLALRWRVYGVLLMVATALLALFMYIGSGRLILTWFMD